MVDIIRETPISIRKAAEKLGVARKTVYVWASARRDGKPRLETIKFGGKRMTSLEALQRFGQENGASVAVQPHASSSDYERSLQALREQHGF